ncbi:hypothetical protein K2X85_05565 [bacterium]|nr:hypothetical protein [bacterium]
MNKPPRQATISARLSALICSAALSGLVAGGVYKIVRASAHEDARPNDYTLTFVDANDRPITDKPGTLKLVLDPFVVYRNAPSQKTKSFTIDEHGFRAGMRSDRPKVFLLGGSAVFGQDLERDDQTLSAQLDQRCPTYSFVNAGVVGYLAGQELGFMAHYADEFQPVGYILIDGWNEVFDQYHFAVRPSNRLGFNNAFFDIENRLAQLAASQQTSSPLSVAPMANLPSPERALEQISQNYRSQVERMASFATSRGAFFLWAMQPELAAKNRQNEAEQRSLTAWNKAYGYVDRGFPQAYARLAREAASTAQKRGIAWESLLDHPAITSSTETLFLDPVHLSPRGTEVVSQILKDRIGVMLKASP